MMKNGDIITVDNTRLLAASRANVKVRAIIHNWDEPLSEDLAERFSTKLDGIPTNWGEAVINRINAQKALYQNTYPFGSDVTGAI